MKVTANVSAQNGEIRLIKKIPVVKNPIAAMFYSSTYDAIVMLPENQPTVWLDNATGISLEAGYCFLTIVTDTA